MEITETQKIFLNQKLQKLASSKFRNSFHLKTKDISYIREKNLLTIEKHARELIEKRLAPRDIPNDGKQTPMRGHPVFIAQHATATCCRECVHKWHHIEKNKELTEQEKNFVVALIIFWIEKELNLSSQNN